MAFNDADMAATLDELLALPRRQQLEYLQGLLIGMQYNTLTEAFDTMRSSAADTDVEPGWRQANDVASELMFHYIEVTADADEVPDDQRFWRN